MPPRNARQKPHLADVSAPRVGMHAAAGTASPKALHGAVDAKGDTRVRKTARHAKTFATFTLPRAVALG